MVDKRHDNLIPQAHVLTVDEQSKGGLKSAEVRNERKKAREIAEVVLSMPLSNDKLQSLDDLDTLSEVDNVDTLTALIVNAVKKALDGSYRHLELVLTLTGDYSKRMQLEMPQTEDESSRGLEDWFNSFEWDDVTQDRIHKDKIESAKFDSEIEETTKWMYHYYNNIYHVECGSRVLEKADSDIIKDFKSATDEHKINFIQRIYRKRDIPSEDAILLFDTLYAPRVIGKGRAQQDDKPIKKNNILEGIE